LQWDGVLAAAFLAAIRGGAAPIPHAEILEVARTSILIAKS
jgi:hypothetical protein